MHDSPVVYVFLDQEFILRTIPVLERLAPASDAVANTVNSLRAGSRDIRSDLLHHLIGQMAVIYRFMVNMTDVSALLPNAPSRDDVFTIYQELIMKSNEAAFEAGARQAHEERDRWEREERLEAAMAKSSGMPMHY